MRTCYLAMRLAERLALPAPDREALFFAAFLNAGCSSNAAAITRLFGADDIEIKRRQATAERGVLSYAAFTIRSLPGSEPLPVRLRRLIAIGLRGPAERQAVEEIRCERGASIARKAGFGEPVAKAILDLHEQWEGGGHPRDLARHQIDPLPASLPSASASTHSSPLPAPSVRARFARRRAGWYEPQLVDNLLAAIDDGLIDDLSAPDVVARTMELEPDGHVRMSDDGDVDRIAGAFADIVDAKSPYTGSHSQRVAEIAESVAATLRLPATSIVDVRRAGLLHDLGKLGVPNVILDKPAALSSSELEVIRRHPQLTLRILEPIPTFTDVAELAACHHERLDGRGYFRGLAAPALGIGARIVAAADVFEALTVDRPSMPAERALGIMRGSVGDHLAADVVEALATTVLDRRAPD